MQKQPSFITIDNRLLHIININIITNKHSKANDKRNTTDCPIHPRLY
jgi:hypothetical protein